MSKTLYLECYSGISGDMTVAALLDLGADPEKLKTVLGTLPLDEFEIEIARVKKSGLDACDFRVLLDEEHDPHDHDMEYLHGHEHSHGHSHKHVTDSACGHSHEHANAPGPGHSHEHEHHHGHEHSHGHTHRGLPEIREIIGNSGMSRRAKDTALRVFEILADAEAKAHGVPAEQVHFHEVGAVDSIVDIAAAAICLDDLDITDVIVSELYEGRGSVRCQHGIIPVPVPAVTSIAAAHGLTLHLTKVQGELVTPTGAAIAAAVRTSEKLPETFRILGTGLGAGKRDYACTGILRAMLIEPGAGADSIWRLETNLDDCTGEALGYTLEELLSAGGRDVYYTPIYMKKNRPGVLLSVICREEDIPGLEQIIFRNTTTIGIRRVKMERTILERKLKTVETPLGEAQVKICSLQGETRVYPEYESVAALCRKHGVSWQEAFALVAGCGNAMVNPAGV